jgi:hypothetical protein
MEKEYPMNRIAHVSINAALTATLSLFLVLGPTGLAQAFCGFYVSKADSKLFNEASQVVLVRDGDKTVITMASDYRGQSDEFAMVIPVPTFIERGQIHIADPAAIVHLDAYSAPRLVEYFDADPCAPPVLYGRMARMSALPESKSVRSRDKALGVTVEAAYTVGEYDILILAAKESAGLVTWLDENGYKIPAGAELVLSGYLKQGMRFFVAKVNLGEQEKLGVKKLRPIQVAYESPKFMLPIRLGMVNSDGTQEMFIYTLTRTGRVETTNYRTVKLPTGSELPPYVETEFGDFYKAMISRQVEAENGRAVFLEYAWDMGWCDPCAADPLSPEELRGLGVFWVDAAEIRGDARNVFLTRLHVRYDNEHFPEDLAFQETSDRSNFQGRYVLRRPFTGEMSCSAAIDYKEGLALRQAAEAEMLAQLTGWNLEDIMKRVGVGPVPLNGTPWWSRLWQD